MLTLRDISAGYGGANVLNGITLHVPDGAVVALVGANGAGKTTLLRTAAGLLHPTAGSIALDGVELSGGSPSTHAAAGICYVPDGRGVFGSLTVRENLDLFGRRSRDGAALEGIMQAFPRLKERLSQTAGSLSGGEQQMLALARAFLAQPKVVLLDEVSTGLAPLIVDEIFLSLEALAATGLSLLVVEQYVTKALSIADYVCVLARGRLSFVGEPSEAAELDLTEAYLGA